MYAKNLAHVSEHVHQFYGHCRTLSKSDCIINSCYFNIHKNYRKGKFSLVPDCWKQFTFIQYMAVILLRFIQIMADIFKYSKKETLKL